MLTLHGRADLRGRLIRADPVLARLHEEAGGVPQGQIVVPQIASLIRLAAEKGVAVQRPVLVADGGITRELIGDAQPDGAGVDIVLRGWDNIVPSGDIAFHPQADFDEARLEADGAWMTDADLRITQMAAGVDREIGFLPATARGCPFTRVFHLLTDPSGNMPLLAALAKGEPVQDQPAELVAAGGRVVLLSARPMFDDDGAFAGLTGAFNFLQTGPVVPADETAATTDLDRVVSERLEPALRRPISRIIAQADAAALQSAGPLRQDYVRYASDIAAAARHVLTLFGDLSNLQAIEQPDFAIATDPQDLSEIIARARALMRVRLDEKGIRLIVRPEAPAIWVSGDFGRLLQIFVNLLSNAVRYAPDQGQVTITLDMDPDTVDILVADDGPGVAPENAERIFGKFERLDPTEKGGSGLGLYISRRLARAMCGDLFMNSAVEKGACFQLRLRRAPPAA